MLPVCAAAIDPPNAQSCMAASFRDFPRVILWFTGLAIHCDLLLGVFKRCAPKYRSQPTGSVTAGT